MICEKPSAPRGLCARTGPTSRKLYHCWSGIILKGKTGPSRKATHMRGDATPCGYKLLPWCVFRAGTVRSLIEAVRSNSMLAWALTYARNGDASMAVRRAWQSECEPARFGELLAIAELPDRFEWLVWAKKGHMHPDLREGEPLVCLKCAYYLRAMPSPTWSRLSARVQGR